MTIHTIIWDLGGVLVRTEDWQPRDRLAARLGLTRGQINHLVFGDANNHRAQLGEITTHQQWQYVTQTLGLPEEQIPALHDEFFAGDHLDLELVTAIRGLKKNYHTALLSNALDDLRRMLAEEWRIEDAFHTIVISAEVGLMKPDIAIFDLTLEKCGFEPHQAVFIDDMPQNIQGARQAGMHAIRFINTQQTLADLHPLLDNKEDAM